MTGSRHPGRGKGGERKGEQENPAQAPSPLGDIELVGRWRAGDARALTAVVETYSDALTRFAYYLLGSLDWAQDVVQDVFVHIWEHPESFAPTRSVKQYLYAAVRNHALNERKYEDVRTRHRDAMRAAAEGDPSLGGTPSPEEAILDEATIQTALGKLSDRRQQAVRLRIEGQLTHAEIGAVLGISTAAAERLVLRALEDLRKILRVSG